MPTTIITMHQRPIAAVVAVVEAAMATLGAAISVVNCRVSAMGIKETTVEIRDAGWPEAVECLRRLFDSWDEQVFLISDLRLEIE